MSLWGDIKKGVSSVGKAVGGTSKGFAGIIKGAAKATANVGVVSFTTPFNVAIGVAKGGRIDKVAWGALKKNAQAVKDVAPYAQMVVANVPGIGTGVAGAIGAGVALAEGRPLDEAALEGIKGALPGGPAVQAAFEVTKGIATGKPIDAIAVNAMPGTPAQKRAIMLAVKAAKDLANGRPVSAIAIDNALNTLDPDTRRAVLTGIAVTQGQKLGTVKAMSKVLPKVGNVGHALLVPNSTKLAVGVKSADAIVRMINHPNPAVRKRGGLFAALTKRVALKGKTPSIRRAAANGLTLMKKRAAAIRLVKRKYRVSKNGMVVKV